MNVKTLQIGFFIVLLLGVSVLFYFISAPYISAIFLAIVTAVLFKSLNHRIHDWLGGRKNIASFVSTVIVLFIILVPLAFISNLLLKESAVLYSQTVSGNVNTYSLGVLSSRLEHFIEARIPGANIDISRYLNIGSYAERGFIWFSTNLASFVSSLLQLTLSAFLYVLCLFYLFRDGRVFAKNVLAWSPLFDVYDNLILSKISITVSSVLRGQLLVGVIQGTLTGVGFWIFGVSNPVIWGAVATVASLVPMLGTGLVNTPAAIYLMLTGHLFQGLGLLIWATCAVGIVDNLLGPYFINRGVKIHPFLILISVLGGIGLFGPIGFVAGPVVLSLLFALLELYPIIINPRTVEQKIPNVNVNKN